MLGILVATWMPLPLSSLLLIQHFSPFPESCCSHTILRQSLGRILEMRKPFKWSFGSPTLTDHFQSQQKTLPPFLTHSEHLYFTQYLSSGTLLCPLRNPRILEPERALENTEFICSLIHKYTLRDFHMLGMILDDEDITGYKTRHSPWHHGAYGLVTMININF